jgi:HK97 gp10 family phage protein
MGSSPARMVARRAQELAPELADAGRSALVQGRAQARDPDDADPAGSQYSAEVIVSVRKLSLRALSTFKRRQADRRRAGKRTRRIDPRDAYYWFFVEFGTARTPARPFLRPAFDSLKDQAIAAAIKFYEQRVQLEIQKLGRTIN